MRIRKQKKKELSEEQLEVIDTKNFFDRIALGIIRFYGVSSFIIQDQRVNVHYH